MDRPVRNWSPWGPISAVGLFLVLVAVRSAVRSLPRKWRARAGIVPHRVEVDLVVQDYT